MSDYPCSTMVWSEVQKRDVPTKASVYCRENCGSCGFNPDEQARRLREGRFITNKQGGRTLLFPPIRKGDNHEQQT